MVPMPREVGWLRVVGLYVLECQEQQAIAGKRSVDGFDRMRSRYRERLKRKREDDGLTKGKGGQVARVGADGVGRHGQRISVDIRD